MLGAFGIWRLASFKMHSKSGNGSAAMVVVTTGTSSTGQRDVGQGRLREHACLREVGQGGAMAESKGQERSHPWLLADQGLRAHRREKTRREDGGIPGQLLGTRGGAGLCPAHERGDGRATGQQNTGKSESAARICRVSIGLLLLPST
jgi:hypothetical protein